MNSTCRRMIGPHPRRQPLPAVPAAADAVISHAICCIGNSTPKDGTYPVQIQDENLADTGDYIICLRSL